MEKPVTVMVIKLNLSMWFAGQTRQRRACGYWSFLPLPDYTLESTGSLSISGNQGHIPE